MDGAAPFEEIVGKKLHVCGNLLAANLIQGGARAARGDDRPRRAGTLLPGKNGHNHDRGEPGNPENRAHGPKYIDAQWGRNLVCTYRRRV